uniref:Putative secreted protein n=1 Tax=Xenopsylla cheopis TaxID=163159 RepID=A0A6M2DWN5_XENCH
MVQFVLVMVHAFQLLFIECNYPRAFVWWIGMHAVMFYFLFSDFYKQTYNKKERREALKVNSEKYQSNSEAVHEANNKEVILNNSNNSHETRKRL